MCAIFEWFMYLVMGLVICRVRCWVYMGEFSGFEGFYMESRSLGTFRQKYLRLPKW